jgi:uncharacterized paraquat-inducible protein A
MTLAEYVAMLNSKGIEVDFSEHDAAVRAEERERCAKVCERDHYADLSSNKCPRCGAPAHPHDVRCAACGVWHMREATGSECAAAIRAMQEQP